METLTSWARTTCAALIALIILALGAHACAGPLQLPDPPAEATPAPVAPVQPPAPAQGASGMPTVEAIVGIPLWWAPGGESAGAAVPEEILEVIGRCGTAPLLVHVRLADGAEVWAERGAVPGAPDARLLPDRCAVQP